MWVLSWTWKVFPDAHPDLDAIGHWHAELNGKEYRIFMFTTNCLLMEYRFDGKERQRQHLKNHRFRRALRKRALKAFKENRFPEFADEARQEVEQKILMWAESLILTPMQVLAAGL